MKLVAKHEALRLDRADRRIEPLATSDLNTDEHPEPAARADTIEHALELTEVLEALVSLPERKRQMYTLYVLGFTYEVLELDHPIRRFVSAMCLYAGEVLNGLVAMAYSDDDARRRARDRLVPGTDLLAGLAVTDAELAELLNVPLEETRVAQTPLRADAPGSRATRASRSGLSGRSSPGAPTTPTRSTVRAVRHSEALPDRSETQFTTNGRAHPRAAVSSLKGYPREID